MDTQIEAEAMQRQQFVVTVVFGGLKNEKSFSGFNLQDYTAVKMIMEYNMNIADTYV